jgi:hypothetical protein
MLAGGPGMSQTRPSTGALSKGTRASLPFYSPVNYKSGILINDGCTKTKE